MTMLSISVAYSKTALSNDYGVPRIFRGGNNQLGGGNAGLGNQIYGEGKGNEDYADNEPKSYEFGYAVKDQATGNDFGRQESSDGETVRGEYRVQLPDGRIQIVTYTADWRTGFHADVRYEGTAAHPEQFNRNNGLIGNDNAGQEFGFQGQNTANFYNGGNNGGGYNNNYQRNSGSYSQGNNNYQYQFESNGLDNSFGTRTGFGSNFPSPTYGPVFH